MSLDINLVWEDGAHWQNITHNLVEMASQADIYACLWRPETCNVTVAGELVQPLRRAIEDMKARPQHYRQFDSANGWGKYDHFLPWLEQLLQACEEHPEAWVQSCR